MQSFPTAPHPAMSDRYVMIDTNEVIKNMAEIGYQVAEVRGPKFRTLRGKYGFHMVDFRTHAAMKRNDSESPRVIFINSYNGVARAKFIAGIIRWFCTNGVVSGDLIANEVVTHIGDAAKGLIDRINRVAGESVKMMDRIAEVKGIKLTKPQQIEFTHRAVGLVREDIDPLSIPMFNQPRRREDLSDDLWTTFNRVQENLIRGGIPVVDSTGHLRQTHPIRNVQRDVEVNRQLWDLMDNFANEVTA